MKIAASIILCLFLVSFKIDKASIGAADIDKLTGGKWIGKLSYLDYSSNQKTTILADLIVTKVSGSKNSWTFRNEYPKEPKANSESVVTLSEDGTNFDGESVLSRTVLSSGEIQFITTKEGEDKSYRYTYQISTKSFSVKKEEKGKGDKDYFERNVYQYIR